MQAVKFSSFQSRPASVCTSYDTRRLSSAVAKSFRARHCPEQEVVVLVNGNCPVQRRVETPLLSGSSLQNQMSRPPLELNSGVANSPQFSLSSFHFERCMSPERTSVWLKRSVSMGFQNWIAGVCIASAVLVASVPDAEGLNIAMLDSESTTGPITGFLLSRQEQRARDDFSERVSEAVNWLQRGQLAQARGDFSAALDCFSKVTEKAGDLALAEYARVGHAVTLYEVGDRRQAIVEMEDVSISLKGYPEIHAALAAALYADKHAPIPAERQFTIATLLDPRYTDLVWVQETKHWPPSLLKSLQRFISLS